VSGFPVKKLYVGSKIHVIIRGIYKLNKRVYMYLNFPIEIADFYWNRQWIGNPTLPENLQLQNKFQSDFFNKIFQLRLGMGIKL
jgi:hypothetical protein